ncbi:NAD(P)-binding protein [Aaosphaeria arxii CBS 175.79]|uniref:NAD(P)-binding protein n=1 Tax=Aaosphaeria arxii CBS 175.79 TaxID=1450172 RepID=A0A6A5XMA8_9PLEO|nr:NAD(P)-binding protein [Aaosphaeria arxii CBS 175.79]KAF2014083.1 NAD(P)-binding protein [Aaosphaeria arxii CBS 175.79]
MSALTILGNATIERLLLNLSKEEVIQFQKEIEDCLIDYSSKGERQYQPQPGIVNRSNNQKVLFRPFTSPNAVGIKIIVHPALNRAHADVPSRQTCPSIPESGNQQLPLNGVLILCDDQGIPTGLLNAKEITSYRTSLNALIPYVLRRKTSSIIVFGAGMQALWHIRLALALRGTETALITIVNRSEPRAQKLIQTLREDNDSRWNSTCEFGFLNSSSLEDSRRLQRQLSTADVIFCTLPSQQPLFSLASLKLEGRKEQYPLITAVGSWQANMIEVDPEILRYAANAEGICVDGKTPQTILVDDVDNALVHSGEIVQSGLGRMQMGEIGEILLQKRNGSMTKDMAAWLAQGLVVYKSIGVSVTDLAAGNAILALAKKMEVGTVVSQF